jgi:hypothetical protein
MRPGEVTRESRLCPYPEGPARSWSEVPNCDGAFEAIHQAACPGSLGRPKTEQRNVRYLFLLHHFAHRHRFNSGQSGHDLAVRLAEAASQAGAYAEVEKC